MKEDGSVEVSVVMPCLNEAETLERCIAKAKGAFARLGVRGEVVIADNGSTDGSQAIAERLGARVVPVEAKGYGNALRGGIEAARGRYVVMGDSDDSYDFSAIDPFVERLRAGDDLVMGNRFRGGILPGAMPWKHRWIGNPVLTGIGRFLFGCPVGDFHCGLRGFAKDAYARMRLQTTGMEFASEMVIRGTLEKLRISEVPITLHKDGRSRPPHLRSWRDGWRHLRFMLLFSPLWLFMVPGLLLLLGGTGVGAWLLGGPRRVGGVELDIHTLLLSSFAAVVGYQVLLAGLFVRTFASKAGFLPPSPALEGLRRVGRLELGLIAGLLMLSGGIALAVAAVLDWRSAGFGPLDPRSTMRELIPAVTLASFGVQTLFSSFFLAALELDRRPRA